MLLLRKPAPSAVQDFLEQQLRRELTYSDVGATAGSIPSGFVFDERRVRLGNGPAVFEAAREAIARWDQFRIGWLEIQTSASGIAPGVGVAILARSLGCWWLNACRIVYVIDDDQPTLRYGFAYGTLPDHAGRGEECFLVEMDQAGEVWYQIRAFSRPNRLLMRIGYPYMRYIQKRFGRESAAHVQQRVRQMMTGPSAAAAPNR